MKRYNVIVIGSGGGAKISSYASRTGKKAAIIEELKLGGTCLNRGCIPSKMLIYPSNVASMIKESGKFGIKSRYDSVAFGKLVSRISRTVDSDSASIKKSYKGSRNPVFYPYHAHFVSDKVLEVNGKMITSDKIYIATGARPSIPKIEGLEKAPYMTSTEALRNKTLPKRMIVVGGGYIGCEIGNAYSAFGSKVTFVVRGNRFLAREDSDISRIFTKVFSKKNKCFFNADAYKVEHKNRTFTLYLRQGKKNVRLSADALLIATGIKPNTDKLGLENTRIKIDKNGFVRVDKFMETSVNGVYALGDCIGRYMFRHAANFEANYLLDSLSGKRKPIKYMPMPHAVFTNPEIGSVGKTEDELKDSGMKEGRDYIIGMSEYKDSAQGLARLSKEDFVKLIFGKKTKKLIGAHIMGEEAATMVHQLIYAMGKNAKLDDILEMIYIHPALPEIVRNAARSAREKLMR